MFQGRTQVKVDKKGRFGFPALYREGLDFSFESPIVVTNNIFQGHRLLDIYSVSAWSSLEKKISELPALNSSVQSYKRFYISAGQRVSFDKSGRLLLPNNLRQFAGVGSEIVMIGMGEKFEVWDLSAWEKFQDKMISGFEETQAALGDLLGSSSIDVIPLRGVDAS